MLSGVCRFCGCTEKQPCVGDFGEDGVAATCSWIDDEQTICSACLSELPGEELTALANQDLVALENSGFQLGLPLTPVRAMMLCSLLQLAARHPELQASSKNVFAACREIVEALAEFFAVSPVLSEMIRRGDDPTFDVKVADAPERVESKSSLILPS